MSKFKYYFIIIYIVISFVLFNIYAYEIHQFNAKIRIFLMTGKTDVRTFNKEGIPISHTKTIDNFISPFYVIHYGILYSNVIRKEHLKKYEHWKDDPSLKYWNVKLPNIDETKSKVFFKNSLDWLINNVSYVEGKAHFLYKFDWSYNGYPNGKLSKPWWSGLTDSYAIILFLRGYDIFGNEEYLQLAENLYHSVLNDFAKYGSLTELNGLPWIEEYVDPSNITRKNNMSYVLNGMIYSSYSILAYEKYKKNDIYSSKLFKSIEYNLPKFIEKDGWFKYDLIGNNTNIKYYLVTKTLLDRMNNDNYLNYEYNNSTLNNLLAINYIFNGAKTFSWIHFLITFLIVLFFPFLYILFMRLTR